jgi:hypothetical protein
MLRQNLFDGDSFHAQFALVTYRLMMSRKWVTYSDIMAGYMMLDSALDLPCNVSNCDNYGELKKAFSDVRKAIIFKAGKESIEERGNNRNKSFHYIGAEDDPLADMRNAKVINDLKKYWQFCQDSAGFFPTSWLEYFFKDTRDLFDIKLRRQEGEQFISASLDRKLKNIEYLPFLYEAIVSHQVLSIEYKPFNEELTTLTFHPHYLKEYNGRWYLFGHAQDHEPEFGYNVALDRIIVKPREIYNAAYVEAPSKFYSNFFNDIIGVSHVNGNTAIDIRVRAHSLYIFMLTETKPIHTSQETVLPFGKYEDGEYGEFNLHLEVNNEFIGRILQMGDGLEIVAPKEVREIMQNMTKSLFKLYLKGE